MFGGKKKDAPPTTGDAIQKLRETEEMLIKKQDFLEAKIAQELQNAKKHGTKNKRAAISVSSVTSEHVIYTCSALMNFYWSFFSFQALKRKKRYEKQLQQIDGTLSTIEMQREALEGANTNTAVLTTMDEAAKALRAAHMHMDVDKVCWNFQFTLESHDIPRNSLVLQQGNTFEWSHTSQNQLINLSKNRDFFVKQPSLTSEALKKFVALCWNEFKNSI